MRLINVRTYQLESFGDEHPPYAILSHTWQDAEVSLQDFQNLDRARQRRGFAKIEYCCQQAQRDGIEYAWVDTCCIDKTSSAELSEAINSMFRWYRDSATCYAYLVDVNITFVSRTALYDTGFKASRWFWRGWTLQELIAPKRMEFFDQNWRPCGSRDRLLDQIIQVTGIEYGAFGERRLDRFSVAQRMSWAAGRSTSRIEDQAYSLLGIFDVNIPLVYGEGEKAFRRLQEEIIRTSTDHSIFAWDSTESSSKDLLASSPMAFRHGSRVVRLRQTRCDESYELGNKGLRIMLPTIHTRGSDTLTVALNCRFRDNYMGPISLLLSSSGTNSAAKTYNVEPVHDKSHSHSRFGRLSIMEDPTYRVAEVRTLLIARSEELVHMNQESILLIRTENMVGLPNLDIVDTDGPPFNSISRVMDFTNQQHALGELIVGEDWANGTCASIKFRMSSRHDVGPHVLGMSIMHPYSGLDRDLGLENVREAQPSMQLSVPGQGALLSASFAQETILGEIIPVLNVRWLKRVDDGTDFSINRRKF